MTQRFNSAIRLQAMALDLPIVAGHPNRMPFSGVLTRVDEPSTGAPYGSSGKRVLVTRAAAEHAIPSLLGMACGLRSDFSGHDVTTKVALITGAHLDGKDLRIEGFIYAADFPLQAAEIKQRQAELGFSFEARDLDVISAETDPIVITSCVFTGAAIMLKRVAAYQLTSLAAAADRGVSPALAAVQAAVRHAAVTITAPHASELDSAALAMDAAGVGRGHARYLRAMAADMRADAARGVIPIVYFPG
jgi:hypothetical protein